MRVSIWGSCATRDEFEVREKVFDRMVVEDMDRSIVDSILESKPDVVVLDFIDERMLLLDAGVGAWITGSTYAGQTPTWAELRAAGVLVLDRYHPFREPLFRSAVDQLAPRLLALPAEVPVLLNFGWYTPITCDSTIEFPAVAAAKAVDANRQIAWMAGWVAQALGGRCFAFQPRTRRTCSRRRACSGPLTARKSAREYG